MADPLLDGRLLVDPRLGSHLLADPRLGPGVGDEDCHFSMVKMASQSRRCSRRGSTGKPRCSNT